MPAASCLPRKVLLHSTCFDRPPQGVTGGPSLLSSMCRACLNGWGSWTPHPAPFLDSVLIDSSSHLHPYPDPSPELRPWSWTLLDSLHCGPLGLKYSLSRWLCHLPTRPSLCFLLFSISAAHSLRSSLYFSFKIPSKLFGEQQITSLHYYRNLSSSIRSII